MSKHQLASTLKPFEIAPGQIKVGTTNRNGYALADLEKAHARYGESLSDTPMEEETPPRGVVQTSTPLHPLLDKGLREIL